MATTLAALGSVAASNGAFANINCSATQKNVVGAISPAFTLRGLNSSAVEPSLFLGERVWCSPRVSRNVGHERSVVVARGGARFFTESKRVGGRGSGRIIFTPFGPVFAPDYGRSNSGREWERRNQGQDERMRTQRGKMRSLQERYRVQQERIRQMIEEQMRRGARSSTNSTRYRDMALLKELERRLRAEASREKRSTESGQDQSSIDGLMKELERRLRREDEQERDTEEERGIKGATVYDYLNAWMKEWDRGVTEDREKLQKQWEESMRDQADTRARQGNPESAGNTVKEREEVYDPSELQRAEEEERNEKLSEDRQITKSKENGKSREESATRKNRQSDGTVVFLKNEANGSEVFLVGTSHVSQQSAEEVRELIRRVRPDYVMVELDRKRYDSMMKNQASGGRDNPFAFLQQMVQTLTNENIGAMGKLVGVGLSGFYRLLATRGLQPGHEFKVAIEEGKNVGAKIVLGDQDIDLTMQHVGEQMSIRDALQFFAQPMPRDVAQQMSGTSQTPKGPADMFEKLHDRKIVRRLNEEMEKGSPALTKVLLGERNEAMTKALRNLNGKVVAVVGLAHLDGMEQLWHEANDKYLAGEQ